MYIWKQMYAGNLILLPDTVLLLELSLPLRQLLAVSTILFNAQS